MNCYKRHEEKLKIIYSSLFFILNLSVAIFNSHFKINEAKFRATYYLEILFASEKFAVLLIFTTILILYIMINNFHKYVNSILKKILPTQISVTLIYRKKEILNNLCRIISILTLVNVYNLGLILLYGSDAYLNMCLFFSSFILFLTDVSNGILMLTMVHNGYHDLIDRIYDDQNLSKNACS